MANPKLTRRNVSQVQEPSNWKMDKAQTIASLEDFQKYNVADLDFFDKNDSVMASFANFRTDDIVQTGITPDNPTGGFVRNPAQEAYETSPNSTNTDAVRLYYAKEAVTGTEADAPEIISSPLLAIDITYAGVAPENIIPTEIYGIAKINSITTPVLFWEPELNTYYFEDAFQHDIYGDIVTAGVNEYGNEIPVELVEAFETDTTYYYMILDTIAEQASYDIINEEGLNWGEGKATDGLNYTWEVTTPAWTDVDLVFNAYRFWSTDKINRF